MSFPHVTELQDSMEAQFARTDRQRTQLHVGLRSNLRQLRARVKEQAVKGQRQATLLEQRAARMKRAMNRPVSTTHVVLSAGSDMAMFDSLSPGARGSDSGQGVEPRTLSTAAPSGGAGRWHSWQDESVVDSVDSDSLAETKGGGGESAKGIAGTPVVTPVLLAKTGPLAVFDPPDKFEWQHTAAVLCKKCRGMKIPPPPLPDGWEEYAADDRAPHPHGPYFYNEATGSVLWKPPPGSHKSSIVAFEMTGTCTRACACDIRKEQVQNLWRAAGSRVRLQL